MPVRPRDALQAPQLVHHAAGVQHPPRWSATRREFPPNAPAFPLVNAAMCLLVGDGLTGTPLTTSARISALNIVGELLRKVGVSGGVSLGERGWGLLVG